MATDYTKEFERRNERYGWVSLPFDTLIKEFDISRFPDYENAAEPYIAYILMSRPTLNYTTENHDVLSKHPMTASFYNDRYGRQLFLSMTNRAYMPSSSANILNMSPPWLPLITSRATTYNTEDIKLKTLDKGLTYYGHSIKYGKHSEDHKIGGTISIDFRNDRYLSIIKMMYLWMAYIYLVSKTGDIEPNLVYQKTGILDYAGSLYYLVMRRNGRELVYWEKLTGVFPISAPFSIFSYSDTMILNDRIPIEFAYSIRSDPCDPEILIDINYLSGEDPNSFKDHMVYFKQDGSPGAYSQYDPFMKKYKSRLVMSTETPFNKGILSARVPYCHMVRSGNGSGFTDTTSMIQYFLDWLY